MNGLILKEFLFGIIYCFNPTRNIYDISMKTLDNLVN